MKKLESGLLRLSCLLRGVTTVLLFWGGIHLHHRWESASNLLYRYDPRGNLWIKGALMNQRRVDFYLGTMGDCLIAVEGSNDSGALSSGEVYHPAEDYWTYVAGLPRFTYGHEGIIHKGIVYISRGHDYRCDMLSYDPKTADTWTERQAMILARGWHSMASLDNRICVIGGSGNHEDSMERFDVLGWKPLTRRLISGPR